jgi:outer membrane lipoprotein-sorting protein
MRLRRIVTIVLAACLCATSAPRAAAQSTGVGPEWSAFQRIAAHFTDATFMLVNQVTSGDQQLDSKLRVWFRKPHFAKCEVVAGNGAGGIAVWRGGDMVLVRPPGLLSRFVLALHRDDPHVVDARGRSCGQTTLDNFATDFAANGTLAESPGPNVDGAPTDVVTWTRDPGDTAGDSKRELLISRATHLPAELKSFAGERLVEDSFYRDIRLDTGLPFSTFDL